MKTLIEAQVNTEKDLTPEMYKFKRMKDELGYGDEDIAELRTLCGCTRYISIPPGYKSTIDIAFSRFETVPSYKEFGKDTEPEHLPVHIREFELQPWQEVEVFPDKYLGDFKRVRKHLVYLEKATEFGLIENQEKEIKKLKDALEWEKTQYKAINTKLSEANNTIVGLRIENWAFSSLLYSYTNDKIIQFYRKIKWKFNGIRILAEFEYRRFIERVSK